LGKKKEKITIETKPPKDLNAATEAAEEETTDEDLVADIVT
jgi:hypothetical protein